MAAGIHLLNHFLIAMPAMEDPYFAKSLVYIAEHNDQGALGIIVNRPIDMTLAALFERIDLSLTSDSLARVPVFFGGPVQTDRGFVLHRPLGEWHSTLKVTDEIGLTSSRDVLQAIGAGGEPRDVIVTLGYAGWSAGQLEQELADGAWLVIPPNPKLVFDTPIHLRWQQAAASIGVNPLHLSSQVGHS